jgi:hypothetical protein
VLVAGHSVRIKTTGTLGGAASRETVFLLNNLFLTAVMLTGAGGNALPLIAEAIRGVKVSVGEPFFNRMAVPAMVSLIFLMGVGPSLPMGKHHLGGCAQAAGATPDRCVHHGRDRNSSPCARHLRNSGVRFRWLCGGGKSSRVLDRDACAAPRAWRKLANRFREARRRQPPAATADMWHTSGRCWSRWE